MSWQFLVWSNVYVTLVPREKVPIVLSSQNSICSPRLTSCGGQAMGAQSDGQMTLAGTAGSTCGCHPAARGILPLQIQLWSPLHLHCVQFELGHAV